MQFTLAADSLHAAEIQKRFAVYGFLKIEQMFPTALIESLNQALTIDSALLHQGARIHRSRYIVPIPLAGPFNTPALYAHPALLFAMRALLGPDCILASLGAVIAMPGATEQHIHADHEPLFKEEPLLRGALPPYAITVAVPLIDIDETNGPTKIWIGSHRSSDADRNSADLYSRALLLGVQGSCYFWDYRTLHAGGSNFSEAPRPLLYMAFTRRWFKDLLNPDELILDETQIPEEHRDLFGFPIAQRNKAAEAAFNAERDALLRSFLLA